MGRWSDRREAFVATVNFGGLCCVPGRGEQEDVAVSAGGDPLALRLCCTARTRQQNLYFCAVPNVENSFWTRGLEGRSEALRWEQGSTPTYSLVKRPWRGFWSYRRTPVHLSRRLVRSSVHSLWDRWSLSPARLYDASLWVASAGAVETTLLTLWKVLRSEVTCAVRGCSDVLSSPYASFFGIPLTFFGAVTYSLLAFFTLQARREREAKARSMQTAGVMTSSGTTLQGNHDSDSISFRLLRLRIRIEGICYQDLMFAASTFIFVFSGYLVWLLVFELQAVCPWCIFSAVSSTILFLISCVLESSSERTDRQPKWKRLVWVVGCSAALSLSSAAASYAAAQWSMRSATAVPQSELHAPLPIESHSSQSSIVFAKYLKSIGARMYGAYWCEHCKAQKELFGREAFSYIEYVECSKYGVNGRMNLCRKRHVPGYPTWEIRGEMYPGKKSLAELREISGYTGP
ncbi:hypothetical protein CCYA_CCYA04G1320 [Cyanidiococcus yangmingshanensis]|nr:hypothetical protein CCYA_CCYA04G1320 [Cyanidiococcus yangmingshanensis]